MSQYTPQEILEVPKEIPRKWGLLKGTAIEIIEGVWYVMAVEKDLKPELPSTYYYKGEDFREGDPKYHAFPEQFYWQTRVSVLPMKLLEVSFNREARRILFLVQDPENFLEKEKTRWLSGSRGELIRASLYKIPDLMKKIKENDKQDLIELLFKKAELDIVFGKYLVELAMKDCNFYQNNMVQVDKLFAKR